MHRNLARQLRKLGVQPDTPPGAEEWAAFLERVGRSYEEADRDRYMLERSITLSSREMLELNARLAWERDQFAQFFHSAPAGMMRIELDGLLSDLNAAFERIVGQRKDAISGQALWDIAHADDAAALRTWFAAVVSGSQPGPIESRFMRPEGESVLASVGASLVGDEQGRPTFAVAVVEDMTERSRLEMQLRLAQKLESIGRLAAGIAHEINTPVQFVGDHANFLATAVSRLLAVCDVYRSVCDQPVVREALSGEDRTRLQAQDEVRDHIRRVLPEAVEATLEGLGRVENIVQAMRTFAHPPRGQRRSADVNAALRSTLTVAANQLKYVADVTADLQPLPPVPCYLSDLNQVFLNIVVNAAHAIEDVVRDTDGRGRITVRTRCHAGSVIIEISDTGRGIPPEIHDRIFDPFFTTKEVGRGTGQGLAIARSVVVEKHGGTLTFETAPGQGTTFFIRLPLAAEDDQSQAGEP
jgi:two-component system NtrC family sensor kinase